MSKIKVGVAQVPQTIDVGTNLVKVIETMDKAAESGVELLCFPETHLSGYRVGLLDADATFSPQVLENALCEVSEKCRELEMGVIVGTETENGKDQEGLHVIEEEFSVKSK